MPHLIRIDFRWKRDLTQIVKPLPTRIVAASLEHRPSKNFRPISVISADIRSEEPDGIDRSLKLTDAIGLLKSQAKGLSLPRRAGIPDSVSIFRARS